MVKYYTLDEAARLLQISPDKLREMANKKEIRAFQDKGTLRFRSEDVEERARVMGQSSDPGLPIGEAPAPRSSAPASAKRSAVKPEPIRFEDDSEEISLDLDPPAADAGPASGRSLGNRSGARSPRPAGDSDVRLSLDSVEFNLDAEEARPSSSKSKKPARKSKVDKPSDSDVKLEQDDSAVPLGASKPKSPSDSDIRLEGVPPVSGKSRKDAQMVTEEIDLDAEDMQAARQAPPAKGKPKPRATGMPGSPALPTSSPFELSEADVDLDAPKSRPSHAKGAAKAPPKSSASKGPAKPPVKAKGEDSSDDFELTPFEASGESTLPDEEDVDLGGSVAGGKGASGINLGKPVDSGISLEGGGSDELEFDLGLSLDVPASGALPGPADSSSEFELSIDDAAAPAADSSDSEFELTLDDPGPAADSSDSEFELTLDEGGGEAADHSDSEFELSLDEGEPTGENSDSEFELTLDADGEGIEPGGDEDAAGGSDSEFELSLDAEGDLGTPDEEEKDIFEPTNFDVPPLEDESASEVSLEEGEEGESGSDVVALDDEEEADEGAATVAKARKGKGKGKGRAKAPLVEDEEVAEDDASLDEDEDPASTSRARRRKDEDEDEDEERPVAAEAERVPWGPLPAILLFPTVIVLFLVGLMAFELAQSMSGYHRPNKMSKPIIDFFARSFDENLPKD